MYLFICPKVGTHVEVYAELMGHLPTLWNDWLSNLSDSPVTFGVLPIGTSTYFNSIYLCNCKRLCVYLLFRSVNKRSNV